MQLNFDQNKRSVFFMLSKPLAVLALGRKAMRHWHHVGTIDIRLNWACLTVPKSMKRHRKIYEK
jgi:hypothetical protein